MSQRPPQLRFLQRQRDERTTDGQPPRLAPPRPPPDGARSLNGFRRLTQPLPLVGITLLVVAAIGYIAVAAGSRTRSTEIVVAARNLPAGSQLTRGELGLVKLSTNQTLLSELVPATAESSLLGRRLSEPVLAGLPIGKASVAVAGGGPAVFTLAVPALHALGGNLNVGDRVSVLATFTSATGTSTTHVVARDLVVLAVGQLPTGISDSSATVPVTVALPDPSVASELALANSVAKIDLLRDGTNATAAIPAATAPGNGAST